MTTELAIWAQFIARPAWFDQAACRDTPVAVFFPNQNEQRHADTVDISRAKRICATCPVRSDCLAYGLEERQGIWGGRSQRERRIIRRAA